MKSKINWVRRGQRVIRMVGELHRMGFQHLRIMPYQHPNAWRLAVGPKDCFSLRNGASLNNNAWDDVKIYSSAGDGNHYFDWQDAKNDNARSLAEKFLLRFPNIAKRGAGRDWCYAGWLSELISVLEEGDLLPITEWEYMKGTPDQLSFLPIWSLSEENIIWNDYVADIAPNVRRFPLPPSLNYTDEEVA